MNVQITIKAAIVLSIIFGSTVHAAESSSASVSHAAGPAHGADTYFARVGKEEISMREYQLALQAGMRKRFYHGKIPEAQLVAFRQEVSQTLIDRILLLQEARRLGLKPEQKQIEMQVNAYAQRYANSEQWKNHQQDMLPGLKRALEEDSLLKVLEARVRDIAAPTDDQIAAYYQANPGLFTTPEQLDLSIIMLRVAPSAGSVAWQAAQDEALHLIDKLNRGSDFSSLARIHSGDKSASDGGKLERLHAGMLAEPVQKVVNTLQDGQISTPIITLQGVAIVRLEKRLPAQLNALGKVKQRAAGLWQRQQAEQAWSDLKETLRASASVSINSAAL